MTAIRIRLIASILAIAALLATPAAAADSAQEQFFVSIFYKGSKVGQAHIRLSRSGAGEIEEMRARASVSLLGVNLYEFTQDQTQVWDGAQLKSLSGHADENGKALAVELAYDGEKYTGTLNGKAVTLPGQAFPEAVWHYAIVDQDLLFSQVDLALAQVEIQQSQEQTTLHGKTIPTLRAEIRGEFTATVWFDDKDFVKAEYELGGRRIELTRDP